MKPTTLLHINSSGRASGSATRSVSTILVERLQDADPSTRVVNRDLATGLPFVDEQWIGANFTDPQSRSDEQREALAGSDVLVSELRDADTIVIAAPIYNFSIPAVLKAWIDLVARARETFRYTEDGPVGLLTGKKAYLVMASGGVTLGSEIDFASRYLRHLLAFLGIRDVQLINANEIRDAGELSTLLEELQGEQAIA